VLKKEPYLEITKVRYFREKKKQRKEKKIGKKRKGHVKKSEHQCSILTKGLTITADTKLGVKLLIERKTGPGKEIYSGSDAPSSGGFQIGHGIVPPDQEEAADRKL